MRLKGSYTIEAAILVPVYLFAIVCVIRMSIAFYMQIENMPLGEQLQEVCGVEDFYKYQRVKGVLND